MKKIDWDNLGFEARPADKMFLAEYRDGRWDDGEVLDYGAVSMEPAAGILNYGQGVFEGMKAYRTRDSRLVMFRPYANARRLNEGCRRLWMPELDEEFFVSRIADLAWLNRDFIPPYGKGDLYIRPLLFGSGPVLGVNPAPSYTFCVFMSPVGPYFKAGFSGIRVEVREDYHRAPLYGTGAVKAVGNYATSLLPKKLVKENGYDEVLYLDARESRYIEEVGSANVYVLKDNAISTPKLKGSILPGITRDSVLMISEKALGLKASERDVEVEEVFTADELFCTGTAAVITPILNVGRRGKDHVIGTGKPGPKTTDIYHELRGIQLGEKPDTYGWIYELHGS
jgi:branched-chain amino acid aminotransferase